MEIEKNDTGGSSVPQNRNSHEHLHRLAIYCQPERAGITRAAQDFLAAGHETMHFVGAFFGLARKMDDTLDLLGSGFESFVDRNSLIKYSEAIEPYKDLAIDLLNVRIVDIFLNYLTDLIAAIYTAKPELLKSNSEMKVDAILNHSTMEELIQSIAEKKVNDLAYLGFANLVQSVEKQMGLNLVPDPEVHEKMLFAIEFRNIFVHNHGIVNKTFMTRMPQQSVSIGDKLKSNGKDWATTISVAVLDIDKRASAKFSLTPTTLPAIPRLCGAIGKV